MDTGQICSGCTDSDKNQDSSACWYTQWYIWFVLGLFIVVFFILIILYIKHRKKERSRVSRLHRRNGRITPIRVAPLQPPPYSEPSHKPPSYEEALSHSVYPSYIPGYMEPQIHQSNRNMQVTSIIPVQNPDQQPRGVDPPSYRSIIDGGGAPI
ncbi:hypothetical protein CHS0354_031434 [Potamilus streckersoni]|uniref:Uncharacterized protein n=1 Tax=Potamilus streckersoni TaxID=2493646 RepID=A0AAE0SHP2_9BIVA|nr:hypothetical protein CHS0354_031434 [Potamilus streckersoni]